MKLERWTKGVEGKFKEVITVMNMESTLFPEEKKTGVNRW